MAKSIWRPYHFKKVILADLHFGGWKEEEASIIADCVIACIQRGYPADLEALKRYDIYIVKEEYKDG